MPRPVSIAFRTITATYTAVDGRSLALMRVFASLVVLADMLMRILHLHAHYGIGSVMPPQALVHAGVGQSPLFFVPFLLAAVPAFPLALLIAAMIGTCFVLFGYKTRVSTAASWILLLMVQSMNPLILSGADVIVHLIFFLGIFLPWGDHFSVDRALRSKEIVATRVSSPWSLALLLQISLVYFFASLLKSKGVDWQNGTAVYYALSTDLATPFGALLLREMWILPFLTHAVRLFQLAVPFLLFFPVRTSLVRATTGLLLALMHLTFGIMLHIGIYSWISLALLACLIPSGAWDALSAYIAAHFGRVTTFYNGACEFCKKASRAIQAFFVLQSEVAPTQSSLVASHRPRTCAREEAPLRDTWIRRLGSVIVSALATLFIIAITLSNVQSVVPLSITPLFGQAMRVLGLTQNWTMFSPNPRPANYRYAATGITQDGQNLLVYREPYPDLDERWHKYFHLLSTKGGSAYRRYFLAYVCEQWNATHGADLQITSAALSFTYTPTPLPGISINTTRVVHAGSISCKPL